MNTLLKNNLARKLNRVHNGSVNCERVMVPTFKPALNPLSAAHEHEFAFLYHLESREKIQGRSVRQAKAQGKSGLRKVIDPPALGSRISVTSRSLRRTAARQTHTNPALMPQRMPGYPFGKGNTVSHGSNYSGKDGAVRQRRNVLYLYSLHQTGPTICKV